MRLDAFLYCEGNADCCCHLFKIADKLMRQLTNERPTWCHLLFYFTYYALNMFRTLIYPSSGACDCVDELPHLSSCSLSLCVGAFVAAGIWWCSFCRQQQNKSSNTQRTENKTTDVVIHQHSRKLLKMDILMSETCWAHKKWNKIASDIKLVFHSSTTAKLYFVQQNNMFRPRLAQLQVHNQF